MFNDVCQYAKQCALYRSLRRASAQGSIVTLPSICHDPEAAPRCRRARYLSVYGDDAPLSMPPLTGRPAGRVWLRA